MSGQNDLFLVSQIWLVYFHPCDYSQYLQGPTQLFPFIPSPKYLPLNLGAFLGYLSQNSSSYNVVEVIIMSLKIVFPQPNYKLVEGQYSHVFEISQQSSDFLLQ